MSPVSSRPEPCHAHEQYPSVRHQRPPRPVRARVRWWHSRRESCRRASLRIGMAEKTGIAWCDSTFNPVIGCTKVGPGCDNCYAAEQDSRRRWDGGRIHWGPGVPRYRTSDSNWAQPLRWNAKQEDYMRQGDAPPWRVFCGSHAPSPRHPSGSGGNFPTGNSRSYAIIRCCACWNVRTPTTRVPSCGWRRSSRG